MVPHMVTTAEVLREDKESSFIAVVHSSFFFFIILIIASQANQTLPKLVLDFRGQMPLLQGSRGDTQQQVQL